ncbi:hypothetical protein ACSVCE_13645 [Chromobacterium haemolyticum]|uniref:hypothetical protein n=1 Tax=Chromobacterium haemolyticum TaxID=394935 RepID=UPI0040555275
MKNAMACILWCDGLAGRDFWPSLLVNLVVSNSLSVVYNVTMLKLTPQQIVNVAQLSDQALRHWRHVLPPLAGLNGYTPCFEPGDALALLVVRYLVKVMGINVSTLAAVSTDLFALCRSTSWPKLADKHLLLHIEQGKVSLLAHEPDVDVPVVLIPMRPFAEQLQAAWANSFPAEMQLSLQFPTTFVSRTNRVAKA